ncbi:MAG: AgmX/PglI C-terminal domain-containing protein [Deltaproteobacteria bacterium]|nr:AgmX/PglI C-terminal domain-containing protein [Deltaproteobacteria bacterium]
MKHSIAIAALTLFFAGCERKTETTTATTAKKVTQTKAIKAEPQTILDLPDPLSTATQHSATGNSDQGASDIYRLLRRNLAMVNACYKRQRRRDPELSGKLTVKMRIGAGPKGLVEHAEVIARTFQNSPMERCVVGSLKAFSFPRKDDESLEMTIPLLFR